MTTNFGILQFAKIAQPDFESGYTLDDNAIALIVACQLFEKTNDIHRLIHINTYLHFIKNCLQANGKFINYIDKHKNITAQNDIENLEDSNGRAIWALGYVISLKGILPISIIEKAEFLLEKALPHLSIIHSTRAMGFIIKGLHYQNNPDNFYLLKIFADRLIQMYRYERSNDWSWFEHYLSYGNSVLPEALLCAYLSTNNKSYKNVAKLSFDFLLSKILVDNQLKVISNKDWLYNKKNKKNQIDCEQPIDVAYTIIALKKFYTVFKDEDYKQIATLAFNWFLGENHLQQIVYNPCTGGCYDGVEEHNINLNQGATATLSYLMARLAIEQITNTENIAQLNDKLNYHI